MQRRPEWLLAETSSPALDHFDASRSRDVARRNAPLPVWYEGQRIGLGEEFLAELGATLARVLASPRQYPVIRRATRRVNPKVR